MADENSTDSPRDGLAVRGKEQLRPPASLVKRGLHALTPVIDPTTIQWSNATITGQCYKARKHYGPPEFPGTRQFYFVCRLDNTTDYRQCPGELRIFFRSGKSAGLTEASDATLVMLYRNETKYRNIDLERKDWTLARLKFDRTFPISRPTVECQEELLGDTVQIVAHDSGGNVTIILKVVSS